MMTLLLTDMPVYQQTAFIRNFGEDERKMSVEETIGRNDDNTQPYAYLFAYFKFAGGPGDDKRLYYAYSIDGKNFTDLNGGRPVLSPAGMRDPFIIRNPVEKIFYLIHTIAITSIYQKDFGIWESVDMVHWEKFRTWNPGLGAICTWAPTAEWDESKKQFFTVWSHAFTQMQDHRLYAAWTRDFMEFTHPFLLVDPGFSCIDPAFCSWEGKHYLYFKDERHKEEAPETYHATRRMEADKLEGPYYNLTGAVTEHATEGAILMKDLKEELWYLYYEISSFYAPEGVKGRYKACTSSHPSGPWELLPETEYHFPEGAKHGSMIYITKKELDYLKAALPGISEGYRFSSDFSAKQGVRGWRCEADIHGMRKEMEYIGGQWKVGTSTISREGEINTDSQVFIAWKNEHEGSYRLNGTSELSNEEGKAEIRISCNGKKLWDRVLESGATRAEYSLNIYLKKTENLEFSVRALDVGKFVKIHWKPLVFFAGRYCFADDFSSLQGHRSWYYKEWNGFYFRDLLFDEEKLIWKGIHEGDSIGRGIMKASRYDIAVVWKSPGTGCIKVEGEVAPETGRMEAALEIKKGEEVLWLNIDASSGSGIWQFDLKVNVTEGEQLAFILKKTGNNKATVCWNISVEYV